MNNLAYSGGKSEHRQDMTHIYITIRQHSYKDTIEVYHHRPEDEPMKTVSTILFSSNMLKESLLL